MCKRIVPAHRFLEFGIIVIRRLAYWQKRILHEVDCVVTFPVNFFNRFSQGLGRVWRHPDFIRVGVHQPVGFNLVGQLLFAHEYLLPLVYPTARDALNPDHIAVQVFPGNGEGVVGRVVIQQINVYPLLEIMFKAGTNESLLIVTGEYCDDFHNWEG